MKVWDVTISGYEENKYHKGILLKHKAIYLNYCKDYIYKTKTVSSIYENIIIAIHHSVFIFGIGYLFKKNKNKAINEGLKVDADLPTEYQQQKKKGVKK